MQTHRGKDKRCDCWNLGDTVGGKSYAFEGVSELFIFLFERIGLESYSYSRAKYTNPEK